ncbi:hypothetical protein F2Q69_00002551 [Brassica cretica]|uniref:Uncharacterized protein n=1 Tax=Brassica cretica TaxID=69181 RepID=A0A8S9P0M3_BRACR|nr:hypothetical protein F2Q69_00002551 [Brassica cretica]
MSSKRVATQRSNACSLGRYVATELEPNLGRYIATEPTELEPKLGRYAATERTLRSDRAQAEARSLRSDRALPKRRYEISPCILFYPSMLTPEDRSEPISHFLPF